MANKCLSCISNVIDDLESDVNNEVPMWYKKAGNYSRLPKFLNCSDGYNAFEGELKEGPPELNDNYVELPIEIKQKNNFC